MNGCNPKSQAAEASHFQTESHCLAKMLSLEVIDRWRLESLDEKLIQMAGHCGTAWRKAPSLESRNKNEKRKEVAPKGKTL